MKRKFLVGTLVVMVLGSPALATASELDCFPMCAEPAKTDTRGVAVSGTSLPVSVDTPAPTSCEAGLVKEIENINDKVKPIRELVGYVRSPQGLALKLVNDHVVKIPAWIGYVMDPLGSIKRQAIGEVRSRIKGAMHDGDACGVTPASDPLDVAEAIDAKHSI